MRPSSSSVHNKTLHYSLFDPEALRVLLSCHSLKAESPPQKIFQWPAEQFNVSTTSALVTTKATDLSGLNSIHQDFYTQQPFISLLVDKKSWLKDKLWWAEPCSPLLSTLRDAGEPQEHIGCWKRNKMQGNVLLDSSLRYWSCSHPPDPDCGKGIMRLHWGTGQTEETVRV